MVDLDGVKCDECGSELKLSSGPGRFRSYRGQSGYKIPADFEFLCCSDCGAEWLSSSQVDQLSKILEEQRIQRQG